MAALLMTPVDPNDYSNETDVLRLILEIVVVLFNLFETTLEVHGKGAIRINTVMGIQHCDRITGGEG